MSSRAIHYSESYVPQPWAKCRKIGRASKSILFLLVIVTIGNGQDERLLDRPAR